MNSRSPRRALPIIDSERWLGPLLIGPAVLYIVLLVGLPFLMAIYYSVSNTTTGGGTLGFVGLRNFTNVVGTPKFQTALKNTLMFEKRGFEPFRPQDIYPECGFRTKIHFRCVSEILYDFSVI